jgi:hypothetical protein
LGILERRLLFLFHTALVSNDVKKTMYANSFGASVVESMKKRTVLVISTVGVEGWWQT